MEASLSRVARAYRPRTSPEAESLVRRRLDDGDKDTAPHRLVASRQ
jgi:hypothetical protein